MVSNNNCLDKGVSKVDDSSLLMNDAFEATISLNFRLIVDSTSLRPVTKIVATELKNASLSNPELETLSANPLASGARSQIQSPFKVTDWLLATGSLMSTLTPAVPESFFDTVCENDCNSDKRRRPSLAAVTFLTLASKPKAALAVADPAPTVADKLPPTRNRASMPLPGTR